MTGKNVFQGMVAGLVANIMKSIVGLVPELDVIAFVAEMMGASSIIKPQGKPQIVNVSHAPFVRPKRNVILRGIKFIQDKQYPIRGTLG